jgi:hypothetical protein
MSYARKKRPVVLSVGVMACNEEISLKPTLESLLRQSVFDQLAARHFQCEIIVIANGCTDRTADVARELFARIQRPNPASDLFTARVIEIPEAGRNNAWNRFVHEFSAVEARFLVSMHADILLHHRDALSSLVSSLERLPHVNASSGRRCADVLFKERKTFWERLALAGSPADGSSPVQLNGELICLRAPIAREIFLPRGLEGGFDRFVTQIVATNFLCEPFDARRITFVRDAAHICAAHVGPSEVLESKQRRMIGQTAAHVLLDYLRTRSNRERRCLNETLRSHEAADTGWLEKLVARHVRRRRFFAHLFPGVLRVGRSRLHGLRRLKHIPETAATFVLNVIACLRAHRSLRSRPADLHPAVTRVTGVPVSQLDNK